MYSCTCALLCSWVGAIWLGMLQVSSDFMKTKNIQVKCHEWVSLKILCLQPRFYLKWVCTSPTSPLCERGSLFCLVVCFCFVFVLFCFVLFFKLLQSLWLLFFSCSPSCILVTGNTGWPYKHHVHYERTTTNLITRKQRHVQAACNTCKQRAS